MVDDRSKEEQTWPIPKFRFEVDLEDELKGVAFQEVSGISMEFNVEEVSSGGENRFKYKLPSVSNSQNLVLKRGIATQDSNLIKWCESTLSRGLTSSIITKDISVRLLDEKGVVLFSWTFYNAYPIKFSVSNFSQDTNSIIIETIELAYNYFEATKNK